MSRKTSPVLPKVTETMILRGIRDFLRVEGWYVIRNQMGLGCHRGMTDLTAVRAGQVVWIEVKTPQGRLSEDQEKFRRDIEEHGGNWLLARSVEDVEDLARPEAHRLPLGVGLVTVLGQTREVLASRRRREGGADVENGQGA